MLGNVCKIRLLLRGFLFSRLNLIVGRFDKLAQKYFKTLQAANKIYQNRWLKQVLNTHELQPSIRIIRVRVQTLKTRSISKPLCYGTLSSVKFVRSGFSSLKLIGPVRSFNPSKVDKLARNGKKFCVICATDFAQVKIVQFHEAWKWGRSVRTQCAKSPSYVMEVSDRF